MLVKIFTAKNQFPFSLEIFPNTFACRRRFVQLKIHNLAFVRIYKFCTACCTWWPLLLTAQINWMAKGCLKEVLLTLFKSSSTWLGSRLWKDMSFVFNQRVKEDRLVRSGLACRSPSRLRKMGAWQVHQVHQGKTKDHLDPCYWDSSLRSPPQ